MPTLPVTTRRGFFGWLAIPVVAALLPWRPRAMARYTPPRPSCFLTVSSTDALNEAWRNSQAKLLEGFRKNQPEWRKVIGDA